MAHLYSTSVASPTAVDALITLLRPHLPYSLTILGYLFHSAEPNPDNFAEPRVKIWTSQPQLELSISADVVFSVLLFTPADHQFRFFCSAESAEGSATMHEEAHVLGIMQSAMSIVGDDDSDSFRTIMPLSAYAPPASSRDMGAKPFLLGTVHEKWARCLRTCALKMNSCTKFVCPPRPASLTPVAPPGQDYIVDKLEEADIELITAGSGVSRSPTYLKSRLATSLCLRVKVEADEGTKPVAWGLVHADKSIGALHVDDAHRRRGLGHFVMHELVRQMSGTGPGGVEDGGGGALGWNWTDVMAANKMGGGFMRSLEGWEQGWICYWVYLHATLPS